MLALLYGRVFSVENNQFKFIEFSLVRSTRKFFAERMSENSVNLS